MIGANNWSNVTKTVNFTVGTTIRWRVWTNDSSNNLNATDIFQYITIVNYPPTYSGAQTNTTIAGNAILFSIYFDDDYDLHPNGMYVFSTNNSGSWVNDSAVNFTATPQWANVTKTLNSVVATAIGYMWYVNDTVGHNNVTPVYSFATTKTENPSSRITFDASNSRIQFSGNSRWRFIAQ
jgi:hypothetical protein